MDGSDPGLWVVAWTRQGTTHGQWVRWQSAALTERNALNQAWQQAARWGQNPSSEDLARQTLLTPLDRWQLVYFRGNAWTNPLSSAAVAASPGEPTAAAAPSTVNRTPDAIRLLLDLPASTGLGGRLTLDWVRPNFSNTKS
jgi:general secretion pathway protein J